MTNDSLNQLAPKDGLALLGNLTRADIAHRLSNCFSSNELNCLYPTLSESKWVEFEAEVSELIGVFSIGFYPMPMGNEIENTTEETAENSPSRLHQFTNPTGRNLLEKTGQKTTADDGVPPVSDSTFFRKGQENRTHEPIENGSNRPQKDSTTAAPPSETDEGLTVLGRHPNPANLTEKDGGKQGQNPSPMIGTTELRQRTDADDTGTQSLPSFSPLRGLKDFSMLLNQENRNSGAKEDNQANIHLANVAKSLGDFDNRIAATDDEASVNEKDMSGGRLFREIGGKALSEKTGDVPDRGFERDLTETGKQPLSNRPVNQAELGFQRNEQVYPNMFGQAEEGNQQPTDSTVPLVDMDEVMDELKQRLNWEYKRYYGE